jgi:hypothetical protein
VLLIGVTMVRDEADVIEAFVRHNLRSLDGILAVDHCSTDGTREILRALEAEGLGVVVEVDDEEGHRQAETITRLARRAFAENATIVFALDADEFLKMPSRAAFERWIAGVPPPYCTALDWQTYLPPSRDRIPGGEVELAWRRAREAHGLHKVVLTRAFAATPAATVGPGNHTVLMEGPQQNLERHPVRLARCPADVAALAHLPVRSVEQVMRKVETGWRAHVKANPPDAALAIHWRELLAQFEARGAPDVDRFRTLALNYGIAMARWQPAAAIPIVRDPVPMAATNRYGALARRAPS